MQIRMVGQLAALYDKPLGADRALEAARASSAPGSAGGRSGAARWAWCPSAGWAVSGGLAYGATRGLGETAHARLAAGHDLVEGPALDKLKPHLEKRPEPHRGRGLVTRDGRLP